METMNIKKDQQYGMDRIETDQGTVFFRSKNGIFDAEGEYVMCSMAQLRRFEANENAAQWRKVKKKTKDT
jgi:hypothetical protein